MFEFFLVWGFFWLLIWSGISLLGFLSRDNFLDKNIDMVSRGVIGAAVSLVWIAAVCIGHLIAG
jgi:hypothetical protein